MGIIVIKQVAHILKYMVVEQWRLGKGNVVIISLLLFFFHMFLFPTLVLLLLLL